MTLWSFLKETVFPLFIKEIPPAAMEKMEMIFCITLGAICTYMVLYLPFKAILTVLRKTTWKGSDLL